MAYIGLCMGYIPYNAVVLRILPKFKNDVKKQMH